jgi:hypothetical protein
MCQKNSDGQKLKTISDRDLFSVRVSWDEHRVAPTGERGDDV